MPRDASQRGKAVVDMVTDRPEVQTSVGQVWLTGDDIRAPQAPESEAEADSALNASAHVVDTRRWRGGIGPGRGTLPLDRSVSPARPPNWTRGFDAGLAFERSADPRSWTSSSATAWL